jgi:FixJ family two-component response regulator
LEENVTLDQYPPLRNDLPVLRLVDDDESFRRALNRLLRAAGYQVAEYGSVGEMLLAGMGSAPGCMILDIHMPGPSGLDLQEMVATRPDPLPVIFVTAQATVHETLRAMKAGATDVLFKPVDSEMLLEAVQGAVSKNAAQRLASQMRSALQTRYARLSPRERQVLDMVVRGSLNKQISWELGAAERTVKAYRANMMEKMEVRSVADLVRAASQLNLPTLSAS